MKRALVLAVLSILLLVPIAAYAQTGTVAGKVVIAENDQSLANAAVYLGDSKTGTYTKKNGQFTLKNVPVGTQMITVNMMGFVKQVQEVVVKDGETAVVKFAMEIEMIGIEGIDVVSERAKERQTPVAFTDINKEALEEVLGSRDIPLALAATPNVYATNQGGGAGDARVNIRGFDQRNVAIMINGVPVNDMENGWVYWSNWDGVGDATSSIQVQRGLSAVNLATPSIGGTMNIITSPTEMSPGALFKEEMGTGNFRKTTLVGNSGLINGKYAMNFAVVRKTGDGIIDGTWTDAWAYYLSTSWKINENNKLELYAIGAPQRHGQNLYMQNIGAYNHDYAKDLDDYDVAALDDYAEAGMIYNENVNGVNSAYNGYQWFNGKKHKRFSNTFLNERENYYNKPLVNLNWYTKLSEKLNLYSIVYYSGGTGGGTGTYGSVEWDYSGPSRVVDWDRTIAVNDTSSTGAEGILRNSVNNQWTIGAISKAYYQINENFKTSLGVDWRTAEIDHFREVRDLLGADYYRYTGNDFDITEDDYQKKLGDKIAYNFTNTVDWFGGYLQGEYTMDKLTGYLMGGLSTIKYTYENHFVATDTLANGNPDPDSELTAETDWIMGYQTKGGASYRLTDNLDAYVNAGYVSKVPIFDDVIDDGNGTQAEDPENEKFMSFEMGMNFLGLEDKLSAKANLYFTNWQDQTRSQGVTNEDGSEGIVFISGMDSRHMGLEMELNYRPIYLLQFDLAAAVSDWIYTNDVTATYDDYGSAGNIDTLNCYVKDLKVGNAPQQQVVVGASIFPIEGMKAQLQAMHYRENYADWDPFSRGDENDDTQSWEIPPYTVLNLHFDYALPVHVDGLNFSVFAHVFNLLNEEYIQDATDNSAYNGFDDDHDADDAEVFFGSPRTLNAGISVMF